MGPLPVSQLECSVVGIGATVDPCIGIQGKALMKEKPGKIGIDIGAVSLKAVRLCSDNKPIKSFYARHRGEPAKALEAALA